MELHDVEEAMGIRKMLAHDYYHKPRRTLFGFLRIFMALCRSTVQLALTHEISSMALPTPKSPMLLRFQILCIDQLKKNSYFDRKLTKSESEATIWKFFEKWMLWVVSFLGVDAFLPIWILFALDVYCYILSSGYRNWKF